MACGTQDLGLVLEQRGPAPPVWVMTRPTGGQDLESVGWMQPSKVVTRVTRKAGIGLARITQHKTFGGAGDLVAGRARVHRRRVTRRGMGAEYRPPLRRIAGSRTPSEHVHRLPVQFEPVAPGCQFGRGKQDPPPRLRRPDGGADRRGRGGSVGLVRPHRRPARLPWLDRNRHLPRVQRFAIHRKRRRGHGLVGHRNHLHLPARQDAAVGRVQDARTGRSTTGRRDGEVPRLGAGFVPAAGRKRHDQHPNQPPQDSSPTHRQVSPPCLRVNWVLWVISSENLGYIPTITASVFLIREKAYLNADST